MNFSLRGKGSEFVAKLVVAKVLRQRMFFFTLSYLYNTYISPGN